MSSPFQRFLIGGGGGSNVAADAGLLIFRLFAGLALALGHGINKLPPSDGFVDRIDGFGFPAAIVFAWLVAIAEFAGGLLLALGFATRGVAAFILLTMTGIVVWAHLLVGDTFRGMELALFFWFTALLFLLAGAGRFSVDGMIRRRVDRTTVSRFVRH